MGGLLQMIKPDALYAHPSHTMYPLWMKFIHENREKFSKVIVVFTNMNTEWDYRNFIRDAMKNDNITFLECEKVAGEDDWRNIAVNTGLKYSDNEWVFFSEEDFFPLPGFWECVDSFTSHGNMCGAFQEGRLHPCCIFVPRRLIERTSKNFGVVRDQHDHFWVFQSELDTGIGLIPDHFYKHMNGLSQNMWMLQNGEEPNFRPDEFRQYCKDCLESGAPIHQTIEQLFKVYTK